ncbi:MAG TPA: Uma2 family endonuclease [Kofleriaceae bacterium]|nr:Uma2 family endonuclease [Kofleriaceae bacterium]
MVALPTSPAGYPMAPSAEEWAALSPAERAEVVAALPGEVTYDEMAMPEGDLHFWAKVGALTALRRYFARQKRRIYLSSELPIYYPGEPRFAPDLLAVFDSDDAPRSKWVVSYEGRGLDWVLEVHVGGDRKKDAELNIARYARLGIPEYFLYDRARNCLSVYRLASREATSYTAIFPNQGLYESRVLGLDAQVEQDRLRFYAGTEPLLETGELVALIHALADDSLLPAEEAERRRAEAAQLRAEEERLRTEEERLRTEAERRRAEEERLCAEAERRRHEAEQEVARLRAEIERLKRARP